MAVHVSFSNVFIINSEVFWKFMAHEDGVNDVRFWTIPRRLAEPLRDALSDALSEKDPVHRHKKNVMTTQTDVNECSGANDGYAGFATPLQAVLSGQFELCVPMERFRPDQRACDPLPPYDWDRAFIRNGSFKMDDGGWSKVVSFPVPRDVAESIRHHKGVISGQRGSLLHFHTQAFCVKPDVLIPDDLASAGESIPF